MRTGNASKDQLRERVADALELASQAHRAGRHRELTKIFAEVDVPDSQSDGSGTVAIALNFFDGWVDASNHDWLHYDGISQNDWPQLADTIATALRSGEMVSDPRVLEYFDLQRSQRPPSLLGRLLRVLRGQWRAPV